MAERSAIEWTDHTFNPWIGCTKVGPGCDHCYAEQLASKRLGVPWGPGAPRRRTTAAWKQPRRWDRRAAATGVRERVFCASLADVFDNEVPAEWRADLFALIRETPNLDWLLVTKRIGNVARMIEAAGGLPANVWLGATIVNQVEPDRDVPKLLRINAGVRFLSMEPLLSHVHLGYLGWPNGHGKARDGWSALLGCRWEDGHLVEQVRRLDWVIVGGESGPGARPIHPDWARSLRDQCAAASVPFLFKQWGDWGFADFDASEATHWFGPSGLRERIGGTPWGKGDVSARRFGKKATGRLLDGHTHDGSPASSGGAPDCAALTEFDASAVPATDVSAPVGRSSNHALSAAKPEIRAP